LRNPLCVAVTGATGFIGRHLLEQLVLDGFSIRALTRAPRASRDTDRVVWINGDLAGGAGIDQLVEGADAVVHCAGAVRGVSAADFDPINVTGTARLARAAAAAGVGRLLSISSLAAREPTLSPYASSKQRGEDALKSSDVPWTIFRPPAVYGPGDKELAPLFALMLRGVAVVPGHPGRTSLLFVTDLVRAVIAWIGAPAVAGRCFELDDGTPGGYDWSELIGIAQQMRGAQVYRVDVPQRVLAAVGAANLWLGRVLQRAPMLTPGKARELFHEDWVCTTSDIRSALLWQPEVRFAEGLRRTFAK